jgi:hypothetical protein
MPMYMLETSATTYTAGLDKNDAYLMTLGAVGSKERFVPYHVTSLVLDMALVAMFRAPAAGEAQDPSMEVSPQMLARAITKSG